MKNLIIGLLFLSSLSLFASEYGKIICFNHGDKEIANGVYQFENSDIKMNTREDGSKTGGFSIVAFKLGSKKIGHYMTTNCADKSKNYVAFREELLSCASGKIEYSDGPYCYGKKIHYYKGL